jgi:hypothetical protein
VILTTILDFTFNIYLTSPCTNSTGSLCWLPSLTSTMPPKSPSLFLIMNSTFPPRMKFNSSSYKISSEALPNPFSGHGKQSASIFLSMPFSNSIMEFTINGQDLPNLLNDFGRIPMDIIKKVQDNHCTTHDNPFAASCDILVLYVHSIDLYKDGVH